MHDILKFLEEKLKEVRTTIHQAESEEALLLSLIETTKRVSDDDRIGHGDTVRLISIDNTDKENGYIKSEMFGVGDTFIVNKVFDTFVHDSDSYAYSKKDLVVVKKRV